ncbi:Ras-related protein Rab-15 [Bagarius yarrelli]|uniref:Ras-related protein Rab-15 n=1 Tax=Bagarius yarrelli TaxID=175774 RepID=A0A556V218_BAGYA|nr:Ras-related protein Rab-15 [Bagarius yarrelli]
MSDNDDIEVDSDGIFLVYDITSERSFQHIMKWASDVDEGTPPYSQMQGRWHGFIMSMLSREGLLQLWLQHEPPALYVYFFHPPLPVSFPVSLSSSAVPQIPISHCCALGEASARGADEKRICLSAVETELVGEDMFLNKRNPTSNICERLISDPTERLPVLHRARIASSEPMRRNDGDLDVFQTKQAANFAKIPSAGREKFP